MRARENKFQFSQDDTLHVKFSEFYLCFHIILLKFDIYFLGLPWENGVITGN